MWSPTHWLNIALLQLWSKTVGQAQQVFCQAHQHIDKLLPDRDAKLPDDALYFLTFTPVENAHLIVESNLVNPERIWTELSVNDIREVKSMVADNHGKILTVLPKPSQPSFKNYEIIIWNVT